MPTTRKQKCTTRTRRTMRNPSAKQLRAELATEKKRVREAYARGWEDGADDEPPITFGSGVMGRGYRSAKFTLRDETSTSQEQAIERSYRQFATNPLAWSIANIGTDYVWDDEGPKIQSFDPDVQKVLDRFWTDDVNDWPGKGSQRVRDLRLYGERIDEAFVRDSDGRVRIGAIDPAEIAEVITDPDNREDIIAVRLKGVQGEEQAGRLLKIIRQSDDDHLFGVQIMELTANRQFEAGQNFSLKDDLWRVIEANQMNDGKYTNIRVMETCTGRRRAWRHVNAGTRRKPIERVVEYDAGLVEGEQYDGQCFLVQINKTSIGLRGRPDGLALIDWLDRYDQMFFDILEHAALLKDIVWDLLVQGGDDPEVKKRINEFKSAVVKAGGVFGHNEKITVNPQNPDLKGADWASLADTVLTLIAAGSRYPVYMLGSGGDANLSTATAQGGPTYRGFKTRQGVVKRYITRILQFVIDCAVRAGKLPAIVPVVDSNGVPQFKNGKPQTKPAREAFEIVMPEIAVKDTTGAVAAFGGLVNAVITAYSAQLLPKREAVEIIARGADLVGVKIDVEKVLNELEKTPGASALPDQLDAAQQADGQEQAAQAQTTIEELLGTFNAGAAVDVKQN